MPNAPPLMYLLFYCDINLFFEDSKFLLQLSPVFSYVFCLMVETFIPAITCQATSLALTATTERVPWNNIRVSSIRKTSSDQLWSLLHLISGICLKEEKKNSTNIHFASSLTYSKRLELRMLIDCTNIPAHWISLSALYSLCTNPKVGLGPVLAILIFPPHLKITESSDYPCTMLPVCFVTSVTPLCRW